MGITGLIGFVKDASRDVNIKNFTGYTAAVDAYCWLHKGAFSCAERLVKGEKTDGYVHFCIKMVNVLLAAKVTPILVFDGCNLPSKEVTEAKRRESREKNRNTAKQYLLEGKIREAREWFQRSIDVTPQMALDVIKACREIGVDCIVAPYEADAQLTYMVKKGLAHFVITEDSDLIPYGCERVLFKMDVNGNGRLFEKSRLHRALGKCADNFTFDKFRYMCIMAGCDYLPSLPGIGLKKSFKFFSMVHNPDLDALLTKLSQYLNMPKLNMTTEYREGFRRANNTFLYQVVFDPIERKLTPLSAYPPEITGPMMIPYAGPSMDNEVGFQIAIGNMDVTLMKPMAQYTPDIRENLTKSRTSIWDRNYQLQDLSSLISSVKTPERKSTKNTVSWVDTSGLVGKYSKRPRPQDTTEDSSISDAELIALYNKETASPKRSRVSYETEVVLETPEKCLVEEDKTPEKKEVAAKEERTPEKKIIVRSRFFSPSNKDTVSPNTDRASTETSPESARASPATPGDPTPPCSSNPKLNLYLDLNPKPDLLISDKNGLRSVKLRFDAAIASQKTKCSSPQFGETKASPNTATPVSTPARNPFKVVVPSPCPSSAEEPSTSGSDSTVVTPPQDTSMSARLETGNDSDEDFQIKMPKTSPCSPTLRRSASAPCVKGKLHPVTPKSQTGRIGLSRKTPTRKALTPKGDGRSLKQLGLKESLQRFQFKKAPFASQQVHDS